MLNKLLYLLFFYVTFLFSEVAISASNDKPFCSRKPNIIIGKGLSWSRKDDKVFVMASGGCRKRYPSSPCVVAFKKYGPNDYSVVCGRSGVRGHES